MRNEFVRDSRLRHIRDASGANSDRSCLDHMRTGVDVVSRLCIMDWDGRRGVLVV